MVRAYLATSLMATTPFFQRCPWYNSSRPDSPVGPFGGEVLAIRCGLVGSQVVNVWSAARVKPVGQVLKKCNTCRTKICL